MHKWEKYHEYDPKNPTFSSSLLDQINNSLKNSPKNGKNTEDEKMSSLRRACLVEKWMEKKVSDKVMTKSNSKSNKTLFEEFDLQDTSTSSSSSETEYSVFGHSKQHKPRVPCFTTAPPMPKSVRTRPIESKYLEHLEDNPKSTTSRAVKIYSNLKNLKQPVSPGVKLTAFINSLFAKDNKNKNKHKNNNNNNGGSSSNTSSSNTSVTKQCKLISNKITSYSTCTTPLSYSRSCLSSTKKKFQDDGNKRTVRFCPVSVILDEDSRPCGHKSLFEKDDDQIPTSKFARSLSKRCEQLRMLNGLEKDSERLQQQKKLEEVALDLLSGYWDSKLSKSHNQFSKDEVNDCDYGANYAGNCGKNGGNYNYNDDDDDDGLSCSSSDLFELDHLSLIGNELPVYETTQFDRKLL